MKTFSILLFICLLIPLPSNAQVIKRCQQYSQMVRSQHWYYFGLRFPYHYGIGQLEVESSCRANATSFDGGCGLAQFMPQTVAEIKKHIGEIDVFKPSDAIKAQAWYMARLHRSNFGSEKQLWITYMCYNSGIGTLRKEYKRAGVDDYTKMYATCKRKVLKLQTGQRLDLCQVGYSYPIKVYKSGLKYKIYPDLVRYW